MRLYRETRAEAQLLLAKVKRNGDDGVCIEGKGEIAEIVGLTCLEMDLKVLSFKTHSRYPTIKIEGTKLMLTGLD